MAGVSDRLEKLQSLLQRQPDDTFVLYGLALEHKKSGELGKSLECLNRVLQLDSGYLYAYHQKGLIHEMSGDLAAARAAYREGIAAAARKGDAHARDEIQSALAMIE